MMAVTRYKTKSSGDRLRIQHLQPYSVCFLWSLVAMALIFATTASTPGDAAALNSSGTKSRSNGDRGCYYMLQHYKNGEQIKTDEPCLNCTCENSMLMCYLRVCPYVKPVGDRCIVERVPGECCPKITCSDVSPPAEGIEQQVEPETVAPHSSATSETVGSNGTTANNFDIALTNGSESGNGAGGCSLDGSFYHEGALLPTDPKKPCEICYCINSSSACVLQECALEVNGCAPVYQAGGCCPTRYNCTSSTNSQKRVSPAANRRKFWDNFSGFASSTTKIPASHDVLSFSTSTTARPLAMPNFGRDSGRSAVIGCKVSNSSRIYADGELIPSRNKCEHCYCMRNEIVCAVQECKPPCDGCNPIFESDKDCCPKRYECAAPTQRVPTDNILEAKPETTTPIALERPISGLASASVDLEISPEQIAVTKSETETSSAPTAETTPKILEASSEPQSPKAADSTVAPMLISIEPDRSELSVMTTRQTNPPLRPISPKLSGDEENSGELMSSDQESTNASKPEPRDSSTNVDGFSLNGEREQETDLRKSAGRFVAPEGSMAPYASQGQDANEVIPASITSTSAPARTDSYVSDAPIESGPVSSTEVEVQNSEKKIRPQVIPSIIPGEGSCRYNGKMYSNGQEVKSKDNCMEICMCINSVVYCDEVDCPKGPENKSNCERVVVEGECCPKYVCTEILETSPSTTGVTDSSMSDQLAGTTTHIRDEKLPERIDSQNSVNPTPVAQPGPESSIKPENVDSVATSSSVSPAGDKVESQTLPVTPETASTPALISTEQPIERTSATMAEHSTTSGVDQTSRHSEAETTRAVEPLAETSPSPLVVNETNATEGSTVLPLNSSSRDPSSGFDSEEPMTATTGASKATEPLESATNSPTASDLPAMTDNEARLQPLPVTPGTPDTPAATSTEQPIELTSATRTEHSTTSGEVQTGRQSEVETTRATEVPSGTSPPLSVANETNATEGSTMLPDLSSSEKPSSGIDSLQPLATTTTGASEAIGPLESATGSPKASDPSASSTDNEVRSQTLPAGSETASTPAATSTEQPIELTSAAKAEHSTTSGEDQTGRQAEVDATRATAVPSESSSSLPEVAVTNAPESSTVLPDLTSSEKPSSGIDSEQLMTTTTGASKVAEPLESATNSPQPSDAPASLTDTDARLQTLPVASDTALTSTEQPIELTSATIAEQSTTSGVDQTGRQSEVEPARITEAPSGTSSSLSVVNETNATEGSTMLPLDSSSGSPSSGIDSQQPLTTTTTGASEAIGPLESATGSPKASDPSAITDNEARLRTVPVTPETASTPAATSTEQPIELTSATRAEHSTTSGEDQTGRHSEVETARATGVPSESSSSLPEVAVTNAPESSTVLPDLTSSEKPSSETDSQQPMTTTTGASTAFGPIESVTSTSKPSEQPPSIADNEVRSQTLPVSSGAVSTPASSSSEQPTEPTSSTMAEDSTTSDEVQTGRQSELATTRATEAPPETSSSLPAAVETNAREGPTVLPYHSSSESTSPGIGSQQPMITTTDASIPTGPLESAVSTSNPSASLPGNETRSQTLPSTVERVSTPAPTSTGEPIELTSATVAEHSTTSGYEPTNRHSEAETTRAVEPLVETSPPLSVVNEANATEGSTALPHSISSEKPSSEFDNQQPMTTTTSASVATEPLELATNSPQPSDAPASLTDNEVRPQTIPVTSETSSTGKPIELTLATIAEHSTTSGVHQTGRHSEEETTRAAEHYPETSSSLSLVSGTNAAEGSTMLPYPISSEKPSSGIDSLQPTTTTTGASIPSGPIESVTSTSKPSDPPASLTDTEVRSQNLPVGLDTASTAQSSGIDSEQPMTATTGASRATNSQQPSEAPASLIDNEARLQTLPVVTETTSTVQPTELTSAAKAEHNTTSGEDQTSRHSEAETTRAMEPHPETTPSLSLIPGTNAPDGSTVLSSSEKPSSEIDSQQPMTTTTRSSGETTPFESATSTSKPSDPPASLTDNEVSSNAPQVGSETVSTPAPSSSEQPIELTSATTAEQITTSGVDQTGRQSEVEPVRVTETPSGTSSSLSAVNETNASEGSTMLPLDSSSGSPSSGIDSLQPTTTTVGASKAIEPLESATNSPKASDPSVSLTDNEVLSQTLPVASVTASSPALTSTQQPIEVTSTTRAEHSTTPGEDQAGRHLEAEMTTKAAEPHPETTPSLSVVSGTNAAESSTMLPDLSSSEKPSSGIDSQQPLTTTTTGASEAIGPLESATGSPKASDPSAITDNEARLQTVPVTPETASTPAATSTEQPIELTSAAKAEHSTTSGEDQTGRQAEVDTTRATGVPSESSSSLPEVAVTNAPESSTVLPDLTSSEKPSSETDSQQPMTTTTGASVATGLLESASSSSQPSDPPTSSTDNEARLQTVPATPETPSTPSPSSTEQPIELTSATKAEHSTTSGEDQTGRPLEAETTTKAAEPHPETVGAPASTSTEQPSEASSVAIDVARAEPIFDRSTTMAPSALNATPSPGDQFLAGISTTNAASFKPLEITTVLPSIRGQSAPITIPWSHISNSSLPAATEDAPVEQPAAINFSNTTLATKNISHEPAQSSVGAPESDYEEISEEPGCEYEGKSYNSAQQIPRSHPCDFCFCFRGDIICLQQTCPPPVPHCFETVMDGFCCPRYECPVHTVRSSPNSTSLSLTPFESHSQLKTGADTSDSSRSTTARSSSNIRGCFVDNKLYGVGQDIVSASNPCLDCRCDKSGMMKCNPKECTPEDQLLQQINREVLQSTLSRSQVR